MKEEEEEEERDHGISLETARLSARKKETPMGKIARLLHQGPHGGNDSPHSQKEEELIPLPGLQKRVGRFVPPGYKPNDK